MENGNKIAIISDNKKATEEISSKINLVRKTDVVEVYNYSNAIGMLQKQAPEIIVMYADIYSGRCFDLISDIRLIRKFSQIPVLLVCEKLEQDFILTAFDEGISDYILIDSTPTEFLMRIIWSLQKSNLIKKCTENIDHLINLGVLETDTFFYKEEFVDKVFESIIKSNIEHKKISSFMILTSDIDCKQKLTPALLGSIIKNVIRSTDVVGIKDENKFYMLLNGSRVSQLNTLFERIKEELTLDYSISAGACTIDSDDYETIVRSAKIALEDALVQKGKLIIYNNADSSKFSDISQDDSDMSAPHKNFKLFKQSFTKKLNSVITPVFFQMQKAYEEKLFETRIEQYTSDGKNVFSLVSPTAVGQFVITYPGFSKINIITTFKSKGGEVNNKISLNISELDNIRMTKVLEKFIREFKDINDEQK